MVALIYSRLRESGLEFTTPEEPESGGYARLVFTCWNYGEERAEPWAGAAWVRRRWEEMPEPTVLLGFEATADFKASPEGSLLDLPGIIYVALPANGEPIEAIRQAIREVENGPLGKLDAETRSRNARELGATLRSWRHIFRGSIAQLRGAVIRMAPAMSEESRKKEYELLGVLPSNLIGRLRSPLALLLDSWRSHNPGAKDCGVEILALLESGATGWETIRDALAMPFGNQHGAVVWELLSSLVRDLVTLDRLVAELSGQSTNDTDKHDSFARKGAP